MKKISLLILMIGISYSLTFGGNTLGEARPDVRFGVCIIANNETNVIEGQEYSITYGVQNHGTQRSEATTINFYIWHLAWSSENAIHLGTTSMHPLDPGKSNTVGYTVTIPEGISAELFSNSESYLVGVAEQNGQRAYSSVYPLNVELLPRPDLTSKLSVYNYYNNGSFYVALDTSPLIYAIDVDNIGDAEAVTTHHELWLSNDMNLDFDEDILLRRISQPQIEVGGSYSIDMQTSYLSSADHNPGTYYLFSYVDRGNRNLESNENNNVGPRITRLVVTEPVFKPKKIGFDSRLIDSQVYPNPTNGLINFSNDQEESRTYSLTDLNDRVIKEGLINPFEKLELNIRNEASGLYYLKLVSGNQEVELHKIAKN